ncbi:MAG: class I SAM-dependent methyltransferase [Anaerolineales bacterium]|jgi:SAM-dependent methyltransferase
MLRDFLHKYAFRIWYLKIPPWESGITPPELIDFIRDHRPGKAIDLGCGTGTNAIKLAQHGWESTGVDFIPKAIRKGKEKAQKAGVEVTLKVGDVTDSNILGRDYDLVLDIGCYHSLSPRKRKQYRDNLKQLVKPGGTFLLYAFTPSAEEPNRGVPEDEVWALSNILHLEKREDGEDVTRASSAWFWFVREADP